VAKPIDSFPRHRFNARVSWGKVSLVGAGLLGGSIGLALRKSRLAGCVEAFVRRPVSVAECESLGVVNSASLDLEAVVRDADLVLLCTPVSQMAELTRLLLPALKPGAIVTDVGSTKEQLALVLGPMVANAGGVFIGSHPMGGSERTGVGAARDDLLEGVVCVLTPDDQAPGDAVDRLEQFWGSLGAKPIRMTARLHDELVGRSSHLPHLVSSALAAYVLGDGHEGQQARLCASGFRDMTRLASGSPVMWEDIVDSNRDSISQALGGFIRQLTQLREKVDSGSGLEIQDWLTRAKSARDHWHEAQSSEPNDS